MRRPLTVAKTPIDEVIDTDRQLTRLVFAHMAGAAGWLVFGTLVGLYLSLKFIWPDMDAVSWLGFGDCDRFTPTRCSGAGRHMGWLAWRCTLCRARAGDISSAIDWAGSRWD